MFGSVILDVVIGLFFVYGITAVICSGINELIAGVLDLRAKYLRKGIANLLGDSETGDLVRSFYDSPLIQGLAQPRSRLPSYIPATVFARRLRDLVVDDEDPNPPSGWVELMEYLSAERPAGNPQLAPLQRELRGVLETAGLDPEKVRTLSELKIQLKAARQALADFAATDTKNFSPAAQFLTERVATFEKSVQLVEGEVAESLARAQHAVEAYFNSAMERVSGWYKRRTQIILIVIGVVICLMLNIDTLAIADDLMTEPALRASLVEAAADRPEGAEQTGTLKDLESLGLNLGWGECPPMPSPGLSATYQKVIRCEQTEISRSPYVAQWWVSKWAGLLITMAAAALGAPFWFDLAGKLVNMRMAGRKPEE